MSDLAYFTRRLDEVSYAQGLPGSAKYDLAASTLPDDELEYTQSIYEGRPYGQGGFGMTDVMNEFLSRDPKFLKVNDLSQYQRNLQAAGYLPMSHPATGEWDELSAAASRRSERDTSDMIRAGAHIGAVTVGKGLGYLAAAVPQSIFQGVLGAAQGLAASVTDVATNPVESLEEAGATGGLVTGGIAGFAIGGPVGMAIGGGLGFLGGLAADFFGDDEGEEGQDFWGKVWDSLSPYDEYKRDGAKHFFSLLDTVLLASSALKAGAVGLGITAKSGHGVIPAIRGGVAPTGGGLLGAREITSQGFRQAFKMAAPGSVAPGMVSRMTQAALRRPIVGGAAIGGVLDAAPDLLHGEWGNAAEGFITGGVAGAATLGIASKTKLGAKYIQGSIGLLDKAPLARIAESGAGQVTRSIYTSLAMTSTAGRITADITPGEDPTEKAIKEAPDWGRTGDVIDLTIGSLIYPNRILPIRPKEVGDAMRAMNNTHTLMPLLRAESKRLKRPIDDSLITEVQMKIGAGANGEYDPVIAATNLNRMYLNKQLNAEAKFLAQQEMPEATSIVDRFKFAKLEQEKRAEVVSRMLSESEAGPSQAASELFERSLDDAWGMQTHIETWQGRNTTIDNLVEEQKAQDVLDAAQSHLGEGFRVMPAVKGQFLTKQAVEGLRDSYKAASEQFATARKLADGSPNNELLKEQLTRAGDELEDTILEMRKFNLIDQGDFVTLRQFTSDYKVNPKIVKRLDEVAELRPVENEELTGRLQEAGLDRYVAVNTGENMLMTADIPRLLEYEGLGEVVRHPVREFFADLARTPDEYRDLGPMRYWSIATHLEQVMDDLHLGLDGKQGADTIYDFVRNRNDPEWAKRHMNEMVTTNRTGTIIRRTDAEGMTKRELLKVDPRDLTLDDVTKAFKLDELQRADGSPLITDVAEAADRIKRAMHVGAAFGADMMHPLATLREFGRAQKLVGLQAFQDYARTVRAPVHRWAPDQGFFAKAKKGGWGYVPGAFRRSHLALQFSFNPMFDLSRYMEAISFGAGKGLIPPRLVVNPRKFVRDHKEGFIDPLSGERVFGGDALKAMDRFADHAIYGRTSMQSLDDLQFRVNNAGVAGFKPREVEGAQALWLAQRRAVKGKMSQADLDEVRDKVFEINRYGRGQSAFAKSAHFVFFPFLFQAKQLNLINDFVLSGPTRAAMVHEGFRRWYGIDSDPGLKEDFEKLVENHLPVLKQVARLNNLSYGIGAGRFFLEGLLDSTNVDGRAALDRSTLGKITQGLTQFLLPGGIHTPVGESAGGLMDAARHIFSPVVIYDDGERVTPWGEVRSMVERMVPVYRDVQTWLDKNDGVLQEQITAATSPTHMGGSAQYSSFLDSRRMVKQTFEGMATNLGYSSWDSLSNSPNGAALKQVYDQATAMLKQQFPRGAELAARFVNADEVKSQAMLALADKDSRTDAEEAILQIGLLEQETKEAAAEKGYTQTEMLRVISPLIRQFAMQRAGDRQFLNLWESFYSNSLGPLRVVAA